MQSWLGDLRFALRQMRHSLGFVSTAVLTLALGIGATTAIFTLVYQVILRSIPVAHPEQLYKVGKSNDCCVTGGLQTDWTLFSTDLYRYLRDRTPELENMAAVQAGNIAVSASRPGDNATQPLSIRFVSGNFLPLLDVPAYAGRMLTSDDDREGAAPVAVLSYPVWQTKFAADPHIVGSTVSLTGHPVTIVGITTPRFLGERNETDPPGIWLPLSLEPAFEPDRQLMKLAGSHWLDLLVRIPDPRRIPSTEAALQTGLRQWINLHRELFPGEPDKQIARQTTVLAPARTGINALRDQYADSLRMLLLIAGFVLLIACANTANLMLVRGMARQAELAVRSALGAPRKRLIRQMLLESVLLALMGGIAALIVAYAGTRAILALALSGAELSPIAARPSLPVLGFALGVSLLTGILFGTAPAWISARSSPVDALRGANRTTGDASALPQRLLVILQAALSLALLSTAGLLITSLRHLEHQDLRFEPQGRLIVFTDLQAAGYTYPRLPGLYRRIDDAFSRLPGVTNFAYATYGPMAFDNWSTGVHFSGHTHTDDENASYSAVSAQFFPTIGTHVLQGRAIGDQDTSTSEHVAVVNQTFANRFFKGKQAVGQHFGPDRRMTGEFTVVGVVEDTKYGDPANPTRPMFFTPITQTTTFTDQQDVTADASKHYASNIIVQYRGDGAQIANQVRQTLKSIDPSIPIFHLIPYEEQVKNNFTQQELVVRLTTLFGALALVLASIGLYGVTAYGVARRTSEIGVRMALGATRRNVLGLVVRGALKQAVIGLAIGIPLSVLAGHLVRHTLYQTSGFQPQVLLAVMLLLLFAAFTAALLPARRAAALDPMKALRTE